MSDYKDPFCILPLRDIVVFPNMIVPLFVGRIKSIKALEYAEKNDKEIFLVAQKDANIDEPEELASLTHHSHKTCFGLAPLAMT